MHRRCLAGAVEKCEADEFVRTDGTIDYLKWEVVPWRRAGGEIGGLAMLAEFLNERRRLEEEVTIRDVLRLGLESEGDGVSEATHGLQPLSLLESRPRPRLILLDLLMPGMGRVELLGRLRDAPADDLVRIPVLVMSAVAKSTPLTHPRVRAVLQKPVGFGELFRLMADVQVR